MEKIKTFIIARLAEPSTKSTIATILAGAFGTAVAPEQIEIILAATTVILGWIGFSTKEVK